LVREVLYAVLTQSADDGFPARGDHRGPHQRTVVTTGNAKQLAGSIVDGAAVSTEKPHTDWRTR
jgi:hypothetical protein